MLGGLFFCRSGGGAGQCCHFVWRSFLSLKFPSLSRICYSASFLGNIAQGEAHFCPLSAEDSLPFAHCLVVCCRQTIVWWEQTKCAAAFSLYHLAWNPRIFCWSEASTAYSGCFVAAAFSFSQIFGGQMQRIEVKYASCKTNYGFMTKKRRNVFSKRGILYLCSELM